MLYDSDMSAGHNLFFLDSGSSALEIFLRSLEGKKIVGVQAFTCSTVIDAIYRAGCKPIFMDIDIDYFTTTLPYVEPVIGKCDVLIITHLFGIPNPDRIAIGKLCSDNGVVLIDDLCQTFNAKIGGKTVEELSEAYFYSFFYDKPISCLNGGALYVADRYRDAVLKRLKFVPQQSRKKGRRRLNALFLLGRLLSPEVYRRDFRVGIVWKWILMRWPLNSDIQRLNRLLTSKPIVALSLCFDRFFRPEQSISFLSKNEVRYIKAMMHEFENTNQILASFYIERNLPLPLYLENKDIECSLAKRAIVPRKFTTGMELNVEIKLYNWERLAVDDKSFTNAIYVTRNYVNIPLTRNN